ncbi:MltA domain-containing protein [Sphingomonas sp.]|uniref:murein transglycosylase A n=1 Tax=Sphingomonas sp. TaxID=28214 RepID=UPI001B137EE1|nr:MltA domain-containing protein [Sphingomonas sp.]MBO9711534.1 MltA domain-containing protein [Sphingomonas sp.]
MRIIGVVALALLLGACSGGVVPRYPAPATAGPAPQRPPAEKPRQPVPATPIKPSDAPAAPAGTKTAVLAGLAAGPAVADLPIDQADAERALAAFRLSCPALLKRTDASGLTRPEDWRSACSAAAGWESRRAPDFFAQYFEAVQVADGKAYATGYYEPEIAGSRDHRRGFDVPIYGKPDDLIEADLGLFSDSLKGKKIRGRVDGQSFVPYYDRGAIEDGAIGGHAPVIAWAADPVEVFFLQVQGSGRLRDTNGEVMRIGYGGQNGRDYTGIGALMRDRKLLGPGQLSMQGIMAYLREHPAEGDAIMRENKSFVFFQELKGAGPLGALGYAVTGNTTVAADPAFIPLGAPVFLSMDRTDATGLWVAQDTGGAIKGPNRFDTFWGAGDDARATAGGMSARGTAFVLLPVGTLARLAPPPVYTPQ